MRTRCTIRLPIIATLLVGSFVLAAEKPATRTPERAELWVPSEQLKRVLEKHPNAVMLSAEQYEALIRDAGKVFKSETGSPPPVDAVIESIKMKGKTLSGGAAVMLEGIISIRALGKGWSVSKLSLPFADLGLLASDAGVILGAEDPAKPTRTGNAAVKSKMPHVLLARGPADHQIRFSTILATTVSSASGQRAITFAASSIPTLLELELPVGSAIIQAPPHESSGGVFRIPLNAKGDTRIEWKESTAGLSAGRALHLDATGSCQITESDLTTQQNLVITTGATDQALREIALEVTTPTATVISVEGEDVESWAQSEDKLEVKWRKGKNPAILSVVMRHQIVLPGTDAQSLDLPALRLPGAQRCSTSLTISADEGVELLEVTGGTVVTARSAWWDALTGRAVIRVRKAAPHVVVDADAAIKVERDTVRITRTVNVATDRALNELRLTLPAGEDLLSVNQIEEGTPQQKRSPLEWKQVGQVIELKWPGGLDAVRSSRLSVISRKPLPAGAQDAAAGVSITIENILVPDADKLAGYIALDEDAMWRVTVTEAAGLEDRDARLTPVKGRAAWFSLREHRLSLLIQRRESVVDAEITAFALPRASAMEIEGQIALAISGAPLRSLVLKMTPSQAKHLRFLSPLVGEKQLDDASGEWRLTLAREITGDHMLRFRLSLPVAEQKPLRAVLPRFEMPDARRFRGTWVVEANTDTQLTFEPQSLQPLDVMRVPDVQGYEPRHRLVSAFGYGSGPHSLAITATRHSSSELASLVVSHLALASVLDVDGSSRHEVMLRLSHTGEQFLQLRPPPGAQLLSVLVAERAVKPVRGEDGAIAIPLPAAGDESIAVRLLYDLPGEKWKAAGRRKLQPIEILGNAPVLHTDWRVYSPEGYSYAEIKTGMEQQGVQETESLLEVLPRLAGEKVDFIAGGGKGEPMPSAMRRNKDDSESVGALVAKPDSQNAAWKNQSHLRADSAKTKAGLLPLELDLPIAGVGRFFSGAQAPEVLELEYVSWERQMAVACGLMAAGGLLFWFAGQRAPWLSSLFMVLVLGLAVKLLAEDWLPQANAFLFGWLVALLIWVVFRVFAWLGGVRKEVAA